MGRAEKSCDDKINAGASVNINTKLVYQYSIFLGKSLIRKKQNIFHNIRLLQCSSSADVKFKKA